MYMPKTTEKIGTRPVADEILRALLTKAIKRSPKSRVQIAEAVSLHSGHAISKRMLDDWTAESKKRARLPAAFIEALCEVLADDSLQRAIMGKRLCQLVRLGEMEVERETIRAEIGRKKR